MKQIKVELQETMGSDKSIADSAWTSSLEYQNKKLKNNQDVEKIVKMLADNKHSTPFESVIFKFWIKLPIQTDRQHITHRIASHNGMSGRYRTMPQEFLSMSDEIRDLSKKAFLNLFGNTEQVNTLIYEYQHHCTTLNLYYNKILKFFKEAEKQNFITNKEYKRLREFYRGVLPQNNMTERVTIMNLRSFANYQKLRNSEYAQPEIQQVAKLMLEEVIKSNICPIAIEALIKNNWNI